MSIPLNYAAAAHRLIRDRVAEKIVNIMKPVYFLMRKNRRAWNVTQADLAGMPKGPLGRDLADFLKLMI